MALELQDLSGSSSSDGEQLDFEIPDTEIARALGMPVDEEAAPARQGPSRVRFALKTAGALFFFVAVVAAMGFIFYGEREREIEQDHLAEELRMVETFVQYMPEEEAPVELVAATLKTTDPPPM